jgi:hypothetical protein
MNLVNHAKNFFFYKGIAEGTAILGAAWFLIQSLYFARIQPAMLDEGTYLIKGYYFITGRYVPFQSNGPWTNQMPFSFLIPGFFETIFGPGLRTGRYLSIVCGLLMLLGLWLLGRRLGNRWWAAGLVWIIAANPAFARVYSLAVTQVLMACIFTWILVLVMENPNQRWRLILASALAGFMIVTRVNMAPVLPLLLVYIFWQFGWRSGLYSSLAGMLVVIIGHALYWPGILQMWAGWLPANLTPFLNDWRFSNVGSGMWKPSFDLGDRLSSLLDGLRFNFIPLIVLIGLGILILQRQRWSNMFSYRSAVFLTVLMSFMIILHAWASIWKDYCVYCFPGYLMFFSPLMLLLLIFIYDAWEPGPARWYAFYSSAVAILLTTFAGLGASQEIGARWSEFPIPLFLTGKFRPGTISLWGVLENGLGIPYTTSRWLIPVFGGLFIGVAILIGAAVFIGKNRRMKLTFSHHYGLVVFSGLLMMGFILSPTRFLSGLDQKEVCREDVLRSIESAGDYLKEIIPEGSLVYWKGGSSPVPLLYISNARIFPAQLNDVYSYRTGGDPQALEAYGLWNEALSAQWRQEADYILILEKLYDQSWKEYLEAGNYSEIPRSPSINPCEPKQRLRIFKRESGT